MKPTSAVLLVFIGSVAADLCPPGLGLINRYTACCAASIPGVVAPDYEPVTLSPTDDFNAWRDVCQVDNRWPYCCYLPVPGLGALCEMINS
ncbi:hypothetical protein B0T16DRAFT_462162 [Cercophora newfieldiana]|uniref:Uncharacterized protein n=1 Tax=Cercophora newfieldiana TaxID=92897 RepID=A0AA40CKW0_9PEZI|nr:hypothetical protein B0T16DRAFT_462162 [Cercophora newfieldiana]